MVQRKDRVARDALGKVKIPKGMLYGPSTQRAVQNFPVSGRRFGRRFLFALAQIKLSAARINRSLKLLSKAHADAIVKAAKLVRQGKYDDHFVVDIFQTGSGTSTNMNANEVIANLANRQLPRKFRKKEKIHPNDHVNQSQSSNDVMPSAIHIALVLQLKQELVPELKSFRKTLLRKAGQFHLVYKIGRTHLQDATPVSLGQEFGGYAGQIEKSLDRFQNVLGPLRELALGGTAVGTGLNAPPGFARRMCRDLNRALRESFREAPNHFEAQSSREACMELSGHLRALSVSLIKIANDIRWMGSGPRAGLGELILPALQPGSSMMPGKINPVMAESLLQVAYEVLGNDSTVQMCCQSGNFELNVTLPLLYHKLSQSLSLLTRGLSLFRRHCLRSLRAHRERCRQSIEQSLMLATALVPKLGYDRMAEIAKEAYRQGKTIREIVRERKLLEDRDLERLLDPRNLIQPSSGKSV